MTYDKRKTALIDRMSEFYKTDNMFYLADALFIIILLLDIEEFPIMGYFQNKHGSNRNN